MKQIIASIYLLAICMLMAGSLRVAGQRTENSFTHWVNPFIGTGGHGHVFLGANMPFGAVQLGPVNISEGWDWCSGYHYSDSTIIGFSHTHLSGTGIGDLGDLLVMPATGETILQKGSARQPGSGWTSGFSHATETAGPGYYSVLLNRYQIKAELTASARVGFHRYGFPASATSHVMIDLVQGIGWDRPVDTYVRVLNDSTLEGYRFSKGWASDQRIYFTAIFSRPFKQLTLYRGSIPQTGFVAMGDSVRAVAYFDTREQPTLMLKVGISPVSMENASLNIAAEIPDWDFKKVRLAADAAWNRELGKVAIQATDQQQRIFYTALYHTMMEPALFNDVNGDYYGTDKQVHRNAAFNNYSVFSLWDIYRAAAPLFMVLQPEKSGDFIASLLAIYQQQGRLPVWHLMGNETNTMPGNSAIQVVADAVCKSLPGIDTALAFAAARNTAMLDLRGLKYIKERGFIPADSMVESVAMGMEYAIGDAGIAAMAHKNGRQADEANFLRRAGYYRNYFDSSSRFVRGRVTENTWRTPFSPFVSRHMKDDFSEGNAWQYTWLVPQDVEGLMGLLGGEKRFAAKLDSLFTQKGEMGREASADITGLIGQYAHGNEPGHHIPYLYMYAGQPWKTAEKIRYILDSLYADTPEGICGNEDAGQMSAWYIWSALGMYPVQPVSGEYVFGSPLVNDAVIHVSANRQLHISIRNNSSVNRYIHAVRWNDRPYTAGYFTYADLIKGGELVIEMGPKPSRTWAVKASDRPHSSLSAH